MDTLQQKVVKAFPDGLAGIIFDCDGVILDSQDSNDVYYNLIREGVGLSPMTRADSSFVHQATVTGAFEYLFPPPYDVAAREFSKTVNYNEKIIPMLVLEDGLLELLHWLKSCDLLLGICTNRTDSIFQILHYFSLKKFFNPVKNAVNTIPKPSPRGLLEIFEEWAVPASKVAFIGDSPVDVQAARAAGVTVWAYGNPSLDADLHINSFHELMKIIEPLVEK